MQKSFSEKFVNYCNSENFEINENQTKVAKKIQDYYKKNFKSFFSSLFSKEYFKKCFYLYGDVGVGKTIILNFFFNNLWNIGVSGAPCPPFIKSFCLKS